MAKVTVSSKSSRFTSSLLFSERGLFTRLVESILEKVGDGLRLEVADPADEACPGFARSHESSVDGIRDGVGNAFDDSVVVDDGQGGEASLKNVASDLVELVEGLGER